MINLIRIFNFHLAIRYFSIRLAIAKHIHLIDAIYIKNSADTKQIYDYRQILTFVELDFIIRIKPISFLHKLQIFDKKHVYIFQNIELFPTHLPYKDVTAECCQANINVV